jgi:hypothetical protein
VNDPRLDEVAVFPVGAVLLDLRAQSSWDAGALAGLLACLRQETCIAGRASLHVHSALRGDAALQAYLVRQENLFSMAADGPYSGMGTAEGIGKKAVFPVGLIPSNKPESAVLKRPRLTSCLARSVSSAEGAAADPFRALLEPSVAADEQPSQRSSCSSAEGLAVTHWGSAQLQQQLLASAGTALSFSPTSDAAHSGATAQPEPDGGRCWSPEEAKWAHRQWVPQWSGYSAEELRELGSPPVPLTWEDPARVRFIHCVQAETAASAAPLLASLRSPGVAIVLGCWRASCEEEADGSRDTTAVRIEPGETWTLGRNRLLATVQDMEVQRGYLFEYTVLWDEDVFLFGWCDVGPGGGFALKPLEQHGPYGLPEARPDDRRPACYRQLEAWLLELLPPLASPAFHPTPPGDNCLAGGMPFTPVYWMDAESTFHHRRALDILLPYDTFLETYSAWFSQVQLLRNALRFYGHTISLNLIGVSNPLHRDYKRGHGGHPCAWAAEYTLQEHLVPPSLQKMVKWTCVPCASLEHGLDLEAFGTLGWIEKAGRAAPWPMKFTYQDAAACEESSCLASGLLGSADLVL